VALIDLVPVVALIDLIALVDLIPPSPGAAGVLARRLHTKGPKSEKESEGLDPQVSRPHQERR